MDVRFYHLLTTPLDVALPKLCLMAYEKGMRCCVVAEVEMVKRLDEVLWTFHEHSFLPHGVEDANAAEHPVLLASEPTQANQAELLMITDGREWQQGQHPEYARLFDIFDGNDAAAVTAARERWKHYQSQDFTLSYAKQNERGGWDMK